MVELKYKTRGNSSPQSKPRVYFTCHPKDFDTYFEIISDEILKEQNCAIWYENNIPLIIDEESEMDLQEQLSGMQLFVFPVTLNLLTDKNRALDHDLQFAQKNHIPVLPLIQEANLEDLFVNKFGDVQYLDSEAIKRDSTAISYKERLSKFLSSVLIGDELAAKIRAAFDAYIFLSYRKKDRKYAQELMRLIHKNDFCRDLAIWYDEYLVPGENFVAAIAEAIKKSELFTLVVTPNLLEANNYIIQHEYPMAQKLGKIILPMELVKTDQTKLSEFYNGIPEVTDARDNEMFASILVNSIHNIAIQKQENNPEHDFFIGLAYLSGVDVEVDHERAIELIVHAAESGVVEAIKKLVAMYRNGEAVEKDFELALNWQKNLCEILRKEYECKQDESAGNSYIDALLDLSELYIHQYNVSDAKDALDKSMQVCEYVLEKYDNSDTKHFMFITYYNLISVFKDTDKNKAIETGEKFYNRSKSVFANEPSQEVKFDVYISHVTLGYLYLEALAPDIALKYLYEGQKILEEIDESETKKFEVANVLGCIGDALYFKKQYNDAHKYFREVVEIRESLVLENNKYANRRNLAVGYSKLGRIEEANGNYKKAAEYYSEDLKISKELADETFRLDALLDLALCYENLGQVYYKDGKYKFAKVNWTECNKILTRLYNDVKTNKIALDLARSYFNMGLLCEIEKDYSRTEQYYLESLKLNEEVEHNDSQYVAQQERLVVYSYLGDVYLKKDNYSIESQRRARQYYRKYYEESKKLYDKTGTVDAKRELASSYGKRGYINFLQGNKEESWEFYMKSLKCFKEIAEEERTVQAKQDLASNYYNLMRVAYDLGKKFPAEIYIREVLLLSTELADSPGTHIDLNLLASVYLFVGIVKKDKNSIKKAYEIWRKLSVENYDVEEYKEKLKEAKQYL